MEEPFPSVIEFTRVNDVRQTEICTAEPLAPELSASEVDMAIEKLKSHKSLGINQIPAELVKTDGRKIRSETHKLIISLFNNINQLDALNFIISLFSSLYMFRAHVLIVRTVRIVLYRLYDTIFALLTMTLSA